MADGRRRRLRAGPLARRLEPLVRPLGSDWRIAMAVLAAFPAREVVVSTLQITIE